MAYVINYVGSGGKTSTIIEEADRYHAQGNKVIVTTTTHMFLPRKYPEGCDHLTSDLCAAKSLLSQNQLVWYGHAVPDKDYFTLTALEEWSALCQLADIILVEGDGSRRHPVKAPNYQKEPVIFPGTDKIIIVTGLSGLGHSIGEVCHRPELVCQILNQQSGSDSSHNDYPDSCKKLHDFSHVLNENDYIRLLRDGYLRPLRSRHPHADFEIYLNQVTVEELRCAAHTIAVPFQDPDSPDHVSVRFTAYNKASTGISL